MFKPVGWRGADRAERGCGEAAQLRSTHTHCGRPQEQSQQQVKFETCFMFTVYVSLACHFHLLLLISLVSHPLAHPHTHAHVMPTLRYLYLRK